MFAVYARLERNTESLKDADHALGQDAGNVKAMAAKAEALFSAGQFELALVQFEKGWRLCGAGGHVPGADKCRQAECRTNFRFPSL